METVRLLAPEEVRRGAYVMIMHVVDEFLPCGASCQGEPWAEAPRAAVPVRWLPDRTSMPMKVQEVCLPFVLVRSADGKPAMLDVRRHRLAEVDREFGRRACRTAAKHLKKSRSDDSRSADVD